MKILSSLVSISPFEGGEGVRHLFCCKAMFLQVLLLPLFLGTISEVSSKSPLGQCHHSQDSYLLRILSHVVALAESVTANSTFTENVTESSNSSEPFSLVPTIEHAPYATSPFSFFIPYNQTQSCDIYGPICQTGSITVAVSLNNTKSTSTTLPCSSYLTSQSAYLDAFNNPEQPGANFPFWPTAWQINFGRSPECSSYAHAFDRGDQLTLSGCGVNNKVIPAFQDGELPSQLPPGVLRHHEFLHYQCCGNCSLDVPEVRLFYFPDPNAASYCANRTGVSASANYTTKAINERANSTPGFEVTATLSGQTL